MVVKGVRCPTCKEVIWSRGQHDMRYCRCGGSSVDGGREYLRCGGLVAKNVKEHLVDIVLEPRDYRLWGSQGRILTHREMSTDHIINCIDHLRARIEDSEKLEEEDGYPKKFVENRDRLREIIDEFKEELALRDVYNIPGEVH